MRLCRRSAAGRERPIRLTTTVSGHIALRQAGIGQLRSLDKGSERNSERPSLVSLRTQQKWMLRALSLHAHAPSGDPHGISLFCFLICFVDVGREASFFKFLSEFEAQKRTSRVAGDAEIVGVVNVLHQVGV